MVESSTSAAVYEELCPLLFSIAYRMLASVTEAEDVVQEAFLRSQPACCCAGGKASACRCLRGHREDGL